MFVVGLVVLGGLSLVYYGEIGRGSGRKEMRRFGLVWFGLEWSWMKGMICGIWYMYVN